jgi:hypothetical protein
LHLRIAAIVEAIVSRYNTYEASLASNWLLEQLDVVAGEGWWTSIQAPTM